jgi:hypothetical protein
MKSLIIAATFFAVTGAQQPGAQVAYYSAGSRCLSQDLVYFQRFPSALDRCKASLTTQINSNGGSQCVADDQRTVGWNCLSDITLLPTNSMDTPFMVTEFYPSAGCPGQYNGFSGRQTNIISNVTGAMMLSKCSTGGSVEVLVCTSTAADSCVSSQTVTDGKCVDLTTAQTVNGQTVKSLKFRCVGSGGVVKISTLSSGSGRIAISLLLITPLAMLVSFLLF